MPTGWSWSSNRGRGPHSNLVHSGGWIWSYGSSGNHHLKNHMGGKGRSSSKNAKQEEWSGKCFPFWKVQYCKLLEKWQKRFSDSGQSKKNLHGDQWRDICRSRRKKLQMRKKRRFTWFGQRTANHDGDGKMMGLWNNWSTCKNKMIGWITMFCHTTWSFGETVWRT